jgi:hypothetical protein
MSHNVNRGLKIAKNYQSTMTEVIGILGNYQNNDHLLLNMPQNLAITGYGSQSPLQKPGMFDYLVANLSDISTPEQCLHVGKTGINYGIRNRLFWRSYFDLC